MGAGDIPERLGKKSSGLILNSRKYLERCSVVRKRKQNLIKMWLYTAAEMFPCSGVNPFVNCKCECTSYTDVCPSLTCRMSASPTAQGRTQGSTFTLSCAFPSSLPSGTSLPSWSCIVTGARSPSTSATRRSVWPRHNTPRGRGWSKAHRTAVSLVFTLIWICLRPILHLWDLIVKKLMLFVPKNFPLGL